jgi:SAM-dependent methyltransferase
MGSASLPGNRDIIKSAFGRQASRFARSPVHTDPKRLDRLLGIVDPRPGERALDVACGPGIVTGELKRAGMIAIGLDLTAEMLREASSRGGHYLRGDGARLPFEDGSFDVVVCRNSFHHFADPQASLREMARVLRPEGRVVIEDMQAPDDEKKRAYQETIEALRDVSHRRTLTCAEMEGMARDAGLVGPQTLVARYVIDFDEWIDRAYPTRENRDRALRMMERCLQEDLAGLRVWREGEALKFERSSLLLKAVRPPR